MPARFLLLRALLRGVVLGLICGAVTTQAAELPSFEKQIQPLLAIYCIECHGPKAQEGELRFDLLSRSFDPSVTAKWRQAVDRVELSQMPPEGKPRPSADERRLLMSWVDGESNRAELVRRDKEGRVVLRRLNRIEYQNTIRDLLGVEMTLAEALPPDSSSDGFDNIGEALHSSSFLLDRYLEATDVALSAAIANRPKPKRIDKRVYCRDERQVERATQEVFRQIDDTTVMFSSSDWNAIRVGQFTPQERGNYRIRISAYTVQSDKPVMLEIIAGPMVRDKKNHLVGYFAVPPGKPTVIEFVDQFAPRDGFRILPFGTAGSREIVNAGGAKEYTGPGVAIEWIELEGPLFDVWPPQSHQQIFGDLPQAPVAGGKDRVEVVSNDPPGDARRILRNFACRAFRRNVTDEETQPFVELIEERLAEDYTFEEAVRVGLKGIMTSPRFLFLDEQPGRLDDFALATRLSYFLWSSMPDAELLRLAEQRELAKVNVLREQVERMLRDPKAAALTENFVGQWLKLREINATAPERRLYPEFDDMLKQAMLDEARLFFDEVLKNDLSLTNFVASDFTFLNERLAKHYGIAAVEGHEMRKVKLSPGSRRGGVMTMAGVLKVTANGTATSPVYRGAFVLDRLLGMAPPPPPEGVPAVEPDIRGAVTIREQLAKHREIGACTSCHLKIDPPGFALESYDVIGGWRDHYRTTNGREVMVVDGRKTRYFKGPKVDPADVLADGRRFADIDDFKQLLLADKDQLARGLAGKLLTYATGRAPDGADAPQIDAVVAKVRNKDYGVRALVHEIVQSDVFQNK